MAAIDIERIGTIGHRADLERVVVVPLDIWTELVSALERHHPDLAEDMAPLDRETFPMVVVDRLLAGEHPVKVFREYRGLTQERLASLVGSKAAYISQIENGRPADYALMRLIARALAVEYEMIGQGLRPTVRKTSYEPRWNDERKEVSCAFTVDDQPCFIRMPLEALRHLADGDDLGQDEAIRIYDQRKDEIADAAARAIGEGRRQRGRGHDEHSYTLAAADFMS